MTWRAVGLAGLAGLILATSGCKKKTTQGGTGTPPGTPSADARPECPLDSIALPATRIENRQVISYTLTQIPVSGPISNIPEYHDCQRFKAVDTYGPLVAIFAHHGLDSLFDQISDSTAGSVGQAAAEIYSYDGNYEPLHIRKGYNCLYFTRQNNTWQAYMYWADQDAEACMKPMTSGEPLTVLSTAEPGMTGNDYPPVARWDWDQKNNTQFISIRCGDEWCEVGPSGFEPARRLIVSMPGPGLVPNLSPPTSSNEEERVILVKGWYDTQFLASSDGAGGLIPSHIWGIAMPHPQLERMNSIASFASRWTPSAYILLETTSPEYQSKLGLEPGKNEIAMCSGDFTDCPHESNVPQPACEAAADKKWWARVTNLAGGVPHYFCITRRVHPAGLEIPGTVRWRWDPDDEKTWIRCPQGCCTVS